MRFLLSIVAVWLFASQAYCQGSAPQKHYDQSKPLPVKPTESAPKSEQPAKGCPGTDYPRLSCEAISAQATLNQWRQSADQAGWVKAEIVLTAFTLLAAAAAALFARGAVRTASDHLAHARSESRPYILFQNMRVTERHDAGSGYWEFAFDVINNGQTPARVTSAMTGSEVITGADIPSSGYAITGPPGANPIIPKDGVVTFTTTTSAEYLSKTEITYPTGVAINRVMVRCHIVYDSVIDGEKREYTSQRVRLMTLIHNAAWNGAPRQTEIGDEARYRVDNIT